MLNIFDNTVYSVSVVLRYTRMKKTKVVLWYIKLKKGLPVVTAIVSRDFPPTCVRLVFERYNKCILFAGNISRKIMLYDNEL